MSEHALRLGGWRARWPTRKRLYFAAGAWGLFALVIVIGNCVIAPDRAIAGGALGHDFMAFYTAGDFARRGEFDRMYDIEAVQQFQLTTARQAGLEWKDAIAPFWNPPIYAWIFAPLSALPYRAALGIWWAINAACLAGALAVLWRLLPEEMNWRSKLLLPILVALSLPAWSAFAHGQNSCMSLLILAGAVWCCRRGAGFGAGLLCAMLFYKPQLALVIAIVMWAMLGRRALAGLLVGGVALLLATWLSMPGIIETYLDRMPANLELMQEARRYYWDRHVTLKAFWRLLIQGYEVGPTWVSVQVLWGLSCVMVGSGLCAAMVRKRVPGSGFGVQEEEKNRDLVIASAIVAMPLLMPFYFDYDLLLLAVPAALTAHRAERWLNRAWIGIYVALLLGAGVWSKLGVQGTTLALAALATVHMKLALRREPAAVLEPVEQPLRRAA